MMINTDNLVSITDANQNFSRVARMVDEKGAAIILKNNVPRYILMEFDQLEEEQQAGDARGEIQQPAHPHLIGAAAGGEALGLVALGLFRGDHGVGHSSALLVPFQEYV